MHEQKILDRHITFTDPDYVMYVPKYKDYESDNVHLHVVDHPQFGGLIAFWTQSTIEGAGDNHAMMCRSRDGGKTWSEAKFVIGAKPSADKKKSRLTGHSPLFPSPAASTCSTTGKWKWWNLTVKLPVFSPASTPMILATLGRSPTMSLCG